ncbi:MAG: PP2C family serine/threonine-protein phosphatase [Candidatus Micrarchaeota archaeon]
MSVLITNSGKQGGQRGAPNGAQGNLQKHLLPKDPRSSDCSELSFSAHGLSVAVSVTRGARNEVCQDVAIAHASEQFALFGVLDGYRNQGHVLSRLLGDGILDACGNLPPREVSLFKIMERALSSISGEVTADMGTTVLLALVFPDGNFEVISRGDSGVYFRTSKSLNCLFDHENVRNDENVIVPVVGMAFMDYADSRHAVVDSVISGRLDMEKVRSNFGRMSQGNVVLLATDGVTKNLGIILDSELRVLHASGSQDLCDYLQVIDGASAIRDSVDTLVISRLQLPHRIEDGIGYAPDKDDRAIIVISRD